MQQVRHSFNHAMLSRRYCEFKCQLSCETGAWPQSVALLILAAVHPGFDMLCQRSRLLLFQ
jgi:hypothetical protein